MKLTFLGTRGYIDLASRLHRLETATLIEYRRTRVMLDCGAQWSRRVQAVRPDAIVITHAHPDHAAGLSPRIRCPVYATRATWERLRNVGVPAQQRRVVDERCPFTIEAITFEAVPVIHSRRAPAVGYLIRAGAAQIFYAPDVLDLPGRRRVLAGTSLYVGDGAAISRPIVRRTNGAAALIGHTSIRAQLDWCRQAHVSRMIVTHCGTQLVGGGARAAARVYELARERSIDVAIAYDGWTCCVRGHSSLQTWF